jgi:5-methylcytosine-specific restriction endonuclease McrA
MPIDYKKYPPNWKSEMRPRILKRAGNRCEFCGAENHQPHPLTGSKVVLTIAHLDHDPQNWDVKDERLAALCQKCHLAYDRKEREE